MTGPAATDLAAGGLMAPAARPFNHALWERLRANQLGVNVADPIGHTIGTATAKGGFFQSWTPESPEKQILVGTFDHYSFFNPKVFTQNPDEADFNIYITPDPPFRHILQQVVDKMTPAERRRDLERARLSQGFCVSCEVTPDEGFYDNEWLPTDEPFTTPLVGRKIGVYGPWVRDFGHGGTPEIHPAEIIWWEGPTNRPGVRFTRHFLVLQDDSNRFDRESDFDGPIKHPWSKPPREANFAVALEPRRGVHNRYLLRILRNRQMLDMDTSASADVPLTATVGPGTDITVIKVTSHPSRIGMTLSRVEPDPNDPNRLRCILRFDVSVGKGDRGDEGYALIRLENLA